MTFAHAIYAAALTLGMPLFAFRRRYGRDSTTRRQRAGYLVPPASYRTARPRLWLHGASVGEIGALPPILAELEAVLPQAGIVVSAFTDTGVDQARRLVGAERSFALPVDLPGPLGRAFRSLDPQGVIITETELWPGLLVAAQARGVPVALVNGRLLPASVRRYRLLAPVFAGSLRRLAGVAAQSEDDAARFAAIGVPREVIAVTGSSKFDALSWETRTESPALLGGRSVIVAGSTRPGDEALLLEALGHLSGAARESSSLPAHSASSGSNGSRMEKRRHDPFVIVAPRHLDRVPEVEQLIARGRRVSVRRSALALPLPEAAAYAQAGGAEVLILDTLGELADAYRLGWVAMVGGGFGGRGGHNLLEPAARGRAVVFGPHHRATAGEAERLEAAGGGVRCGRGDGTDGARALAAALEPFLADPAVAAAAGERARHAVAMARGSSRRAVAFVLERLHLGP